MDEIDFEDYAVRNQIVKSFIAMLKQKANGEEGLIITIGDVYHMGFVGWMAVLTGNIAPHYSKYIDNIPTIAFAGPIKPAYVAAFERELYSIAPRNIVTVGKLPDVIAETVAKYLAELAERS